LVVKKGSAAHARVCSSMPAPDSATEAFLQQLQVAQDHRQQVVEVMGNAAAELANGLERSNASLISRVLSSTQNPA